MSKYSIPGGDSSEFEPGSGNLVLRNRLGIITVADAERAEIDLFTAAYIDSLGWIEQLDKVTAGLVAEMHRLWLGELYSFAGEYRHTNISKAGILFCPALNIAAEMSRWEHASNLAIQQADRDDVVAFSTVIAEMHASFILIHPFREGNGRLGRWLCDLLFLKNGFNAPAYDLSTDTTRNEYFQALKQAFSGNPKILAALFVRWTEGAS